MKSFKAKPWFQKGLQFSCTCSGHCCTGKDGYVWMNSDESRMMAKHLQLSLDDFGKKYLRTVHGSYSLIEKKNGDCIFYDTGRCTVYTARPTQCRTYPFWKEVVENEASWKNEAKSCPGINHGTLHKVEEILQRVRDTEEATEKNWKLE